jgi:hypothetical protein
VHLIDDDGNGRIPPPEDGPNLRCDLAFCGGFGSEFYPLRMYWIPAVTCCDLPRMCASWSVTGLMESRVFDGNCWT